MKKIISILKIVLIIAFIAASIYLVINLINIKQGQAYIETIINKDVKFSKSSNDLNMYLDENNIEYWVNTNNNRLIYLTNPNANDTETISLESAKETAYKEAKKWDSSFFESNTICQYINDTNYLFLILQVDEAGYKTGKFLVVEIVSDQLAYLSLNTHPYNKSSKLGQCISELSAIDIAYDATQSSSNPLNKENDYLIKSDFVNEDYNWFWDITIYGIQADTIMDKKDSISHYPFFECRINATTGEIISSK